MNNKIQKIITSASLNKHEKLSRILKYIFIDVCKISPEKYYILGSFAIREHRKINDLDINLDKNEFMKLWLAVRRGFGTIESYNNQIRWFFDLTDEYNRLTSSRDPDFSIEAFMKDQTVGFPDNKFSLSNLIKTNGLDIDENGHQYLSLKNLLKWKKAMNRVKDQPDIRLIEKLCNPKIPSNTK